MLLDCSRTNKSHHKGATARLGWRPLHLLIGIAAVLQSAQGAEPATTCSQGHYLQNNLACVKCSPGYYCLGGSETKSYMLPCAPGSYSAFGASSCSACPAGFKCQNAATVTPTPCASGEYSIAGSTVCTACSRAPAGTLCSTARTLQTCQDGDICNSAAPNDYQVLPCPPTKYCPSFTTQEDCPVGTYSAGGASACTTCPLGTYCPADARGTMSAATEAIACPDGQYQDAPGQSSCKECAAGQSCSDKSMKPVDCQPGTYSLAGATSCSPCPAGFACANPAAWPVVCPEGQYAVQGSSQCKQCDAGHSCADRTQATPCATGSYSNAGEELCTVCPAGHACADSSLPPQRCPIGWYSLPGSTSCTECPAGSACPHVDREPVACRVGEYQDQKGQPHCNKCPPGMLCSDQAAAPVATRTVAASDAEQDTLVVDSFGLRTVKCPAGFACPEGVYDTRVRCPGGTYSPEGSVDCKACPAGSYCADTVNAPIPCSTGTYAKKNSMTCSKCPVGYKCTDLTGRHMVKCSPGTYTRPKQYTWASHATVGIEVYESGFTTATAADSDLSRTVRHVTKAAGAAGGEIGWRLTQTLSGVNGFTIRFAIKFISSVTASNVEVRVQGKTHNSWASACRTGAWCHIDITSPQLGPSSDSGKIVLSIPTSSEAIEAYVYAAGAVLETDQVEEMCVTCEAGFACPVRQGGVNAKYSCPVGYYSKGGATECLPCPPGKYCPLNNAEPKDCATGKVSFGMATQCDDCPAGYTCPNKTSQSLCPIYHYSKAGEADCTVCPTGKTCQFPNQTEPVSCPAGYYADTFDFMCQPCPIGHKCSGGTLTTPTPCPAGQFGGTTAAERCEPCPSGYFSYESSSSCSPIPGGWKGTGTNLNEGIEPCGSGFYSVAGSGTCETCPDGFLCPPMTSEGTAWQNSCPLGSYCAQGVQYLCPVGTFGIAERATTLEGGCAVCPAGYFCGEGTEDFRLHPCPKGHYCPGRPENPYTAPQACPQGFYNDQLYGKSIADCKLCPAGHQCAAGQADRGAVCNEQDYCPRGTYPGQYPCPAGTYGGYMKGKTDVSQCLVCPPGGYCPQGSLGPTKAPAGTYQPNQGVGDVRAVYLCPPGYYCPEQGMVNFKGLPCEQGYYCPAGSSNSKQESCPAGTYSDRKGIHDKLDCETCPKGWRCAAAATSTNGKMTQCPIHHYCPEGSNDTSAVKCPSGTHNLDTMGKSLDDCIPCSPGSYCLAGAGQQNCPAGHYCPEYTNSSSEYPCPVGTYRDTEKGAHVLDCKPCGVGYNCSAGSASRTKCPDGTYNNFTNKAEKCSTCPAGYFCTGSFIHPQPCAAGTYSKDGHSVCTPCDAGHYCPDKATTWEKMMVDQVCAAGLYCVTAINGTHDKGIAVWPNNEDHGCAVGHYCPKGAKKQMPCPKGTYNPARARKVLTDCLLAEAGQYVDVEGASSAKGYCLPGYYCPEGSTSATASACPAGTYRALGGGKDGASCAPCPSGKYCPSRGMSEGLTCLQGYYCPVGTIDPEPCPVGTYGDTTGLVDSRECKDCPAGQFCWRQGLTSSNQSEACAARYYCRGGSSTPRPIDGVTGEVCPAGSYCPSGTTSPVSCGAGYFNRFLGGATKEDDCQKCWAGYYCSETTTGDPTGLCPAGAVCPEGTGAVGASPSSYAEPGYYAPAGSSQQWKCPPGTYNSQSQQAKCTDCPAGSLCADFALTSTSNCQPGYYCPMRSYFTDNNLTYHELACPRGYYQPDPNKAALGDCLVCPVNKYCKNKAQGAVTGDCAPGYYCNERSWQEKPGNATPRTSYLYGPCPAGSYCPGSSVSATPQIKCPAGTFLNITAATTSSMCEPCVAGMVCEGDGNTQPNDYCDVGYYCDSATAVNPPLNQACAATEYCPKGSTSALKCRTGFYQPQSAQSKCLECPSGSYCKDGEKKTCEPGYVCT